MCFSAGASFGAGIVLSVIGVSSVQKIQIPSQFYFASMPFIFAIQQFSEGFLWLALSDPAYAPLELISTYVFLFCTQIVWPFWIPFAILMLETEPKNIIIQKVLVAMGTIVSIYLAYSLISYHVQANIIGHHISYTQDYPTIFGRYSELLFVFATILPPYFSSVKKMWILGVAIFISYIITLILYTDYLVSVWCFFASIISVIILILMRKMKISHQAALSVKS